MRVLAYAAVAHLETAMVFGRPCASDRNAEGGVAPRCASEQHSVEWASQLWASRSRIAHPTRTEQWCARRGTTHSRARAVLLTRLLAVQPGYEEAVPQLGPPETPESDQVLGNTPGEHGARSDSFKMQLFRAKKPDPGMGGARLERATSCL